MQAEKQSDNQQKTRTSNPQTSELAEQARRRGAAKKRS